MIDTLRKIMRSAL